MVAGDGSQNTQEMKTTELPSPSVGKWSLGMLQRDVCKKMCAVSVIGICRSKSSKHIVHSDSLWLSRDLLIGHSSSWM